MTVSSPFKVIRLSLTDSNELHIIDIDNIDDQLKRNIDNRFIKICEGNVTADLSLVKSRVINFLTPKKGSTTEMGAIAEFFIHLYLNEIGFEPQFLYLNLEEGSIKKGFDGYYTLGDEEWILESKSGSISTSGITHGKKVKESCTDLQGKLLGASSNNPWRNAYNHANLRDVAAPDSIIANIRTLRDSYDTGTFKGIEDCNIIPGSTIFLEGSWSSSDPMVIQSQINAEISKFRFKKIQVLCVTKKSLNLFWDYLKMI